MPRKQLWYMQAAATCHFLYHAENGKYRKALTDYVVNHYTSNAREMSIKKAFGMRPDQLGAKVIEFANKVQKGWRPDDGRDTKKGKRDGK